MERLLKKWETAKSYLPKPEIIKSKAKTKVGVIYYGTSNYATEEALETLGKQGIELDALRIRAFPFNEDVEKFIDTHDYVYVVDQNRDAQMRTLLINELELNPANLVPVTYYEGMAITATHIANAIVEHRASDGKSSKKSAS